MTGGEVTGGVVTDVDAMMHRTSLAMPSVINAAAMVVEVTAAATDVLRMQAMQDALRMQEMQDALMMQAMQNVAKMTSDILFALNEWNCRRERRISTVNEAKVVTSDEA